MQFVFIKIRSRQLAFTLYKVFLKDKQRPGTSLPASFSAFLKKNIFSHYILLTDHISLPVCLELLLAIMFIVIAC